MGTDHLNMTIGSHKFKNIVNSQSRISQEPHVNMSTIIQDAREARNASVNVGVAVIGAIGNLNPSFLATNREWIPKVQGRSINRLPIPNTITL